jgi:hypothetical protein
MLTHMSTFITLLEDKRLYRVTLQLPRNQFHERKLYAYPECLRWMREDVPKMKTGRLRSALTPREQLLERLRQWMSGDPMDYWPEFHDMDPRSDEVWELKTDDLRIFGWMYRPKEFIAVRGGYADDYKPPRKTKVYADDRREVVKARNALPLDGDKYSKGRFDELV